MKRTFIKPFASFVYKNKEYTSVKNNPNVENTTIKLFTKKEPKKIVNSPTKLTVPGSPKLPKIKIKKKVAHKGISITRPP